MKLQEIDKNVGHGALCMFWCLTQWAMIIGRQRESKVPLVP